MEWLRIGELARRTGLSQRTLRHYDEIGLLVPSGRSGSDYRLYSRDDAERLLAIQHLKSLGLALADIASALDGEGLDAAGMLARHAESVERRITEETELLARLRRLQQAADSGWEEVLEAIALSERLGHPDPTVRFGATLEGAQLAHAEAVIDLLLDPDPAVREGATWAATQRTDLHDRLVPRLLDGDEVARHALAHVLGKIGDAGALPVLVRLLSDEEERVAAKAAFGLGQLAAPGAADALVQALSDPRPGVREQATAALTRVPDALGPLLDALRDHSPRVREHAADALGLLGDESAAAGLVQLLADEDPVVRLAALTALGQLPGREAERAIENAATSRDERARLLARRLLADRRLP